MWAPLDDTLKCKLNALGNRFSSDDIGINGLMIYTYRGLSTLNPTFQWDQHCQLLLTDCPFAMAKLSFRLWV